MSAILKTLVFTIVAPGTVTVLLPYVIVTRTDAWAIGYARFAGIPIGAAGVFIYAWCAFNFAVKGRGTPAPIDPPKVLVIQGLYQYMRNPMYVGVLTILLGEVFWFASPALFMYAVVVAAHFQAFILFYEEPKLTELFGDQYKVYCENVPRWWPKPAKRGSD